MKILNYLIKDKKHYLIKKSKKTYLTNEETLLKQEKRSAKYISSHQRGFAGGWNLGESAAYRKATHIVIRVRL